MISAFFIRASFLRLKVRKGIKKGRAAGTFYGGFLSAALSARDHPGALPHKIDEGALPLRRPLCFPASAFCGETAMLNAVIFDFDGIIVDSEPMHYEAFRRVLEPMDVSFSWEEYCETYIGFDDRDAFREAFRAAGQKTCARDITRLIREKAAVFQELIRAGRAVPLPGAVALIQSIPRRLPVGLCSGALREDIEPILESLGIGGAFAAITTAEDTKKSKPDPAPYRLSLERLGIDDAATAVAIEDTPAGILSAKGAGLKVLAVTNSYDRAFLLEADAVTDSLENVTRLSLEDMVM
jgi:HAD superfamily hydrolase (TIGR01509 family)